MGLGVTFFPNKGTVGWMAQDKPWRCNHTRRWMKSSVIRWWFLVTSCCGSSMWLYCLSGLSPFVISPWFPCGLSNVPVHECFSSEMCRGFNPLNYFKPARLLFSMSRRQCLKFNVWCFGVKRNKQASKQETKKETTSYPILLKPGILGRNTFC